MHDSFYVNDQDFSGVTSVDSLTTDLYFHFTDLNDSKWKLSGNTDALASGVILEDSDTTSITVTPNAITGYTGSTYQLAVVNQDGVNVLSECTFSALTNKVTVSAGGLITVNTTGTTSVKVTHPDIPLSPTTVQMWNYYPGGVTVLPGNGPIGVFTGYTGETYQIRVITDTGGYDITNQSTFVSSDPSAATVGFNNGLITFVSATGPTSGYTFINVNYGYASGGRAAYTYNYIP